MLDDLPYRIAMVVILGPALVSSARMRHRADRIGGKIRRSADSPPVSVALRVGGLLCWGALLLWALYPPLMAWAQVALAAPIRWLGGGLGAAGMLLGVWALHHLGPNVTPTAVARPDVRLVTTGPYRHVRHPLYSSGLLSIPGFGLLSANLVVLVGGFAALGVLVFRTRREEQELLQRLGDEYARYMDATGRFLPRIR